VQPKPEGLAQAFIIAKEFIGGSGACLVLGDHIFYGDGLQEILRRAVSMERGGLVFGYWVRNPERYGVVEFDGEGKVVSIVEKPKEPVSNYALPGLYFSDSTKTRKDMVSGRGRKGAEIDWTGFRGQAGFRLSNRFSGE
jgi:glucose-1-phosphate thymidylyltransferase